jgi:hypothetical protein
MIVEPAKLDATQYVVQYELLRSQVIVTPGSVAQGDTAGQPRGIGLALLLKQGVPGWLRTVGEALRASLASRAPGSSNPSRHENPPRYSAAPLWLSGVPLHEVTTLLASLVLSTRPVAYESTWEGYR